MGREIRLVAVVSPGLVRLEIRGFNSRYARTDRGLIVGRSTGARWRLIEAADRLAIDDSWSFITLTYPRRWPDSTRARADFKRWRLFLDRGLGKAGLGVELAAEGRHKRGGFGGIWNVEVQGRGAWHFNVVGQIRVCPEVRQIVNETWIQASGTAAAGHLKRRTYCEGIVAGRRGAYYLAREVGKEHQRPDLYEGKVWGFMHRELLDLAPRIEVELDGWPEYDRVAGEIEGRHRVQVARRGLTWDASRPAPRKVLTSKGETGLAVLDAAQVYVDAPTRVAVEARAEGGAPNDGVLRDYLVEKIKQGRDAGWDLSALSCDFAADWGNDRFLRLMNEGGE